MVEPLDDCAQDGSGSVGRAECVVTSGQAAPLLHVAVATLDDVAVAASPDVQPDVPPVSHDLDGAAAGHGARGSRL